MKRRAFTGYLGSKAIDLAGLATMLLFGAPLAYLIHASPPGNPVAASYLMFFWGWFGATLAQMASNKLEKA